MEDFIKSDYLEEEPSDCCGAQIYITGHCSDCIEGVK